MGVAVVPMIAYITAAVSATYAAYAQREQAKWAVKVAERDAKAAENAQTDAVLRGQVEEMNVRRRGWQVAGAQRAAVAASGIDLGTGSSLEVLSDTAMLTELDALTARNNAQREALGYKDQRMAADLEGWLAKMRGKQQTFGTLLTGAAQATQMTYSLGSSSF
jgi:hypothetical protein